MGRRICLCRVSFTGANGPLSGSIHEMKSPRSPRSKARLTSVGYGAGNIVSTYSHHFCTPQPSFRSHDPPRPSEWSRVILGNRVSLAILCACLLPVDFIPLVIHFSKYCFCSFFVCVFVLFCFVLFFWKGGGELLVLCVCVCCCCCCLFLFSFFIFLLCVYMRACVRVRVCVYLSVCLSVSVPVCIAI